MLNRFCLLLGILLSFSFSNFSSVASLPPLPAHLRGAVTYGLALKEGKFYVGRSTKVNERIQAHFNGNGPQWTRKHKPTHVLFILPATSIWDEDNHVEQMMMEHGIQNVRGGTYTDVPEHLEHFLEKKGV